MTHEANPNAYFIETLFRSERIRPEADGTASRSEPETIFSNALKHGAIPAADKNYLAQLIVSATGLRGED